MDAKQYLHYLQEKFKESDEEIALKREYRRRRLTRLGQQTGKSRITEKVMTEIESKHKTEDDYVNETILVPLLKGLPIDVRKKVSDTPFGTLPIRVVNAYAIRSPSGEPLVVIARGLMEIAYIFCEAQSSNAFIIQSKAHFNTEERLNKIYHYILCYYAQKSCAALPTDLIEMPFPYLFAATMILIGMERFILAHEIGHIYSGHLERAVIRDVKIRKDSDISTEFYEESWQDEFEADAIAWRWYQETLETFPEIESLHPSIALSGPLYLFALLHLIEKNLSFPYPYISHPPAKKRLECLINSISKENRILIEMAFSLENFTMWIDLLPDFLLK